MAQSAGQGGDSSQGGFAFDADVEQAAQTYARAVLGAAKKTGRIDAVIEELDSILRDVFGPAPKVEELFSSPRVAVEQKVALVDRLFAGKAAPETVALLKILVRNRRMPVFRATVRAAHGLLDEVAGLIEATVTSAVPLTDAQQEDLKRSLGESFGKHIRLVLRVDDRLLGGLVVRVGDTVYDSSLASRLAQLKKSVLTQTRRTLAEHADRFATST